MNVTSETESAPSLATDPVADQKAASTAQARYSLGSESRVVVSSEEGYELWAEAYDRDPNPLLALEERTLKPLLRGVAGKQALDVACGTGRWLQILLGLGACRAIGVDRSPGMLHMAATKNCLCGRLVRGDCVALPFRSEVAGLIVCSFALGHVSQVRRFASELARVAKVQADVWVTDLHPEGYSRGWRAAFRHSSGAREIVAFAHSMEEVREAFESAGLELVECMEPRLGEPERFIFTQTGKADLFRNLAGLPAVLICHFRRRLPLGL